MSAALLEHFATIRRGREQKRAKSKGRRKEYKLQPQETQCTQSLMLLPELQQLRASCFSTGEKYNMFHQVRTSNLILQARVPASVHFRTWTSVSRSYWLLCCLRLQLKKQTRSQTED